MNDRLEELKEQYETDKNSRAAVQAYINGLRYELETARAEVKRLRKEADITFVNAAHDAVANLEAAEAEVKRLREIIAQANAAIKSTTGLSKPEDWGGIGYLIDKIAEARDQNEARAEAAETQLAEKDRRIEELADALKAAHKHLEYCGYGDDWERGCAEVDGLDEQITEALRNYENTLAEKEVEEDKK
jgi:DNA repair exonuclease SbcCD ATPase subunit